MTVLPGPIRQLGHVVGDLDAAMTAWLGVGVGPWLVLRGARQDRYVFRGEASDPVIDVAFAQSGDLQVELIQPVDNAPSSYAEFLAAGRTGLQHLAWWTEDLDAVSAAANAERWPVVQEGTIGDVRYVYFAPPGDLDVLCEVMALTPTSAWLAERVRDCARDWDGTTDPVRDLV